MWLSVAEEEQCHPHLCEIIISIRFILLFRKVIMLKQVLMCMLAPDILPVHHVFSMSGIFYHALDRDIIQKNVYVLQRNKQFMLQQLFNV